MLAYTPVDADKCTLIELLAKVSASHQAIHITSSSGNGVLLSEEEWRGLQETIYLTSIPGMKDSIVEGLSTPVDQCSAEATLCLADIPGMTQSLLEARNDPDSEYSEEITW